MRPSPRNILTIICLIILSYLMLSIIGINTILSNAFNQEIIVGVILIPFASLIINISKSLEVNIQQIARLEKDNSDLREALDSFLEKHKNIAENIEVKIGDQLFSYRKENDEELRVIKSRLDRLSFKLEFLLKMDAVSDRTSALVDRVTKIEKKIAPECNLE